MEYIRDIKPIGFEPGAPINEKSIETFIEPPLIEPIRKMNEMGIKTVGSGANKNNTKDSVHRINNVPVPYDFGNHHAFIVMDFDKLSSENKQKIEELYNEFNLEKSESEFYNGKIVIYGITSGETGATMDCYKHLKLGERELYDQRTKEVDEFFFENRDYIIATNFPERVVILRCPIDENTKSESVTNYFDGFANYLFDQNEIKNDNNMKK